MIATVCDYRCLPMTQVCIRTDNMELAGDIVQELCDFLNVTEMPSTADFPLEFEALQTILTMVGRLLLVLKII